MAYVAVFDWKRTLYSPESRGLINGTRDLLELLEEAEVPCHLIGKGQQDMYMETRRLDVSRFFRTIVFEPGDKDVDKFAVNIDALRPQDTFVIGDRVRSEIAVGNRLGATTIQVCQGRFANELPQLPEQMPDHIVHSLPEVGALITKMIIDPAATS